MVADIANWTGPMEQFRRYLVFWWRKDGRIWLMTVTPKDFRSR